LKRVAAEFAVNDLGSLRLRSSLPLGAAELHRSLKMTAEVERLLNDGALVTGFEEELVPLGEDLGREHCEIGGADLLLLATVLASSQAALARIAAAEPKCGTLLDAFGEVSDLSEFTAEIGKRLDERGRVRDNASPRMAQLSKKSRKVRHGLYAKLGSFASGHRDNLAEETVSVQDGRLVLLLRSGSKGRLAGVVQGRSSTGRSFYFEPLEFVEENNELQSSQREEEAERQRIFAELLARARDHAVDIREHWDLLADLDARQALCRFRKLFDGHFIEPREGEALELVEARHPLLDPLLADQRERALGQAGHLGPVVPLSLAMDGDHRMLVVTGPNAGGKTVALKTVGLLALAAHCGFPLPAGLHSRMPFLSSLVAVVGDDQDLLAERSTFSGRLLRLAEVWKEAHGRSLLLVDELGSGTDPTEGAALGVALLEALSAKRPWTVITTHLTGIAAAALDLDGAACAAMEFDSGSGHPTYRLVPGAPGGSEALALARRLALPDAWLERAEELLGPEERRLRRLLQEVEASKRELQDESERLAELLANADRDSREAAEQVAATNRERAQLSRGLKRELRDFRNDVRRKLAAEAERLAQELSSGKKRTATAKTVERLFEDAPQWSGPSEREDALLEVGEKVEHASLGWRGDLLELAGDKATVAVHGKRVRCLASELARIEPSGTEERAATGQLRAPISGSRSASTASSDGTVELMLIGQRVEPALDQLESFLDRALLGSSEFVRIVHGHGTGRLRAAVRKRLKGHAAVSSWRPGGDSEGGDGATIVTLAG
jgi:DNA mismatch repair protein MutS2